MRILSLARTQPGYRNRIVGSTAYEVRVPGRALFTWRNALMGGVGAFALWGVVAAFLISTGRGVGPTELGASERPSLAVLPLESISVGGDDDGAFARGIHDEIITRLSQLSGLRVTSRTSVMEYAGQGNMRQIAQELGVDMLIEGSVQRAGGRVSLNVQLIDGRTDEHIWAESYNREYTLDGLFSLQRELAERIATELRMSISPDEAIELSALPTANADAYRTYQEANEFYWSGPRTPEFETAIQLYERAIEQDPDFALAYARLAFSLGQWFQVTPAAREPNVERRTREAVVRALELDPNLPEAYLAQGQVHYALDGNFGLALASLSRAEGTGLKGDYYHLLGAAQRRLGDFDGAIVSWEEMVRVDPKSSHFTEDLGSVLHQSGRFDEAEARYLQAMDLDPSNPGPVFFLPWLYVARDGTTDAGWRILERGREATGLALDGLAANLHYMDRDFEAALALEHDDEARANLLRLLGRTDEAEAMARQAEQKWQTRADSPGRGNAYSQERGARIALALGEADSAAARAEEGVRLLPLSADALDGADILYEAASVFAQLRRADRALDLLEELLAAPSGYSGPYIALDPAFDGIRGESRYQAWYGRD